MADIIAVCKKHPAFGGVFDVRKEFIFSILPEY